MCAAIWLVPEVEYGPVPSSPEDWKKIAYSFQRKWNLPLCLGAIDGKYVGLQATPNTGLEYFNYKGTFSLNLTDISGANYPFLVVDIGQSGRHSDGGVL